VSRAIADKARDDSAFRAHDRDDQQGAAYARYLVQQLGREPSPDEDREADGNCRADKIRKVLKIVKEPVSLETPIGDDEESSLGDFRRGPPEPVAGRRSRCYLNLEEQTRKVLATLTPREEQILFRMRFGIGERTDLTREGLRSLRRALASICRMPLAVPQAFGRLPQRSVGPLADAEAHAEDLLLSRG